MKKETDWIHRRDTRKGDMAHGITFLMWENSGENTRGEAAYKNRKLHVDGRVSVTLAFDQWKYGDELIAQVYAKGAKVLERRADGYIRIQIYLGRADEGTAKMLEDVAKQIRSRVGKTKSVGELNG